MERVDKKDFPIFSEDSSGALFDASQYEFFGCNTVQESELGGHGKDYDDADDGSIKLGSDDEEYRFDKNDALGVESLTGMDDLASTFARLNRNVSGPRHPGVIGDKGSSSFSRESSSATDLVHDGEFSLWLDKKFPEFGIIEDGRRWSSHPHTASIPEPKSLYRTSTYPQPHQYSHLGELLFSPNQSPTSCLPSVHPERRHLSFPSPISKPQNPPSTPGFVSPTGQSFHFSSLPAGGNCPSHGLMLQQQFMPSGLTMHGMMQRPAIQHSLSHGGVEMDRLRAFSSYPSSYETFSLVDTREPKHKSLPKDRNFFSFTRHGLDPGGQRNHGSSFRSKYMTSDEIESILKLQFALSHGGDPYVDDYYYQASLSKNPASVFIRFCPAHLKDVSGRSRSDHSLYFHTESLGKIPLSSIRRPRPLFYTEEAKRGPGRRLDQEPMLAARVTIEDCFHVLVDVEDVDRCLQCIHQQDGGAHLRCRRQVLLQGMAASLQLIDPLGKNSRFINAAKEDVVFTRIVALPKGRNLISRFLQLVAPGSELSRITCMGVCRHLRLLFGAVPADRDAAEATRKLANVVSGCTNYMDLRALGACLVSVVCSLEQPPFRPLGSPSGDGASVILTSLLSRASALLSNPLDTYSMSKLTFWQASFDEFFDLLIKYCLIKYDAVLRAIYVKNPLQADVIDSEVRAATRREMPVELLQACLPHVSEQQMELLKHFGESPYNVTGFNAFTGNGGRGYSEFIRS